MSIAAPFPRGVVEDAIATWAFNATGAGVLWENQKAPAPAFPYVGLRVLSLFGLGQPETRSADALVPAPGAELEITTGQQKRMVLAASAYADTNDADTDARAYMDKLEHALAMPSFQAALSAAGVVVLDVGPAISADYVEGQAWLSCVRLTVTFGVTANVASPETYVETIEAEGDEGLDGVDETFTAWPPP